ncbi:hypothetical protein V2J09_014386 [Rumex salicifolius]
MLNYFDSQIEFEFDDAYEDPDVNPDPPLTCSQGHRSSQVLHTQEGGSICLLCFSNLVSNPNSPTFHVSYALSQLSHALSQPDFLRNILSFHVHFVVSPLILSLSSFDDEQIARQAIDLIIELCKSGDASVSGEFVARISTQLSADALTWSRRQVYTLHCLGALLNQRTDEAYGYIKSKDNLIYNLIVGLQLPRISVLQCARKDDEGADVLFTYAPKLLRLLMEVLIKSQSDEVRLNCLEIIYTAVLKVLTQKGILMHAISSDDNAMDTCESENFMQATEDELDSSSLDTLFAEAIKAPLLSADDQVQSAALDLVFLYLSTDGISVRHIQVMVEENIVDYVFEILRLSELKDHLVSSSLRVLQILSTATQIFWKRLAIGYTTLVSVLPHIAEVPYHPVQTEMLKLILLGVTNCAGAVSFKHIEDISSALTAMLRRHINGEMGMPSEAFITISSIYVALIKSPSSKGALKLLTSIQEASKYALLASLSIFDKDPGQLLHSLYLLKEAYIFDYDMNSTSKSHGVELQNCVLELCKQHLIPWFVKANNEMEEESILGILEILHSILVERRDTQTLQFTTFLLSFSWFRLLFQCLGLYPSERMKCRVYLLLSSIVDNLLGNDSGQPIREAVSSLPMDPIDLLFLLGQRSTNNLELYSCQTAVIQILYSSSYQDQILADDKLILTSLEQYILVNKNDLLYGKLDSLSIVTLISLYSQYRGLVVSRLISHNPEAESIFFKLVKERDWELSFVHIHPTAIKWLFQQKEILDQLSFQILNYCSKSIPCRPEIIIHGNDGQNTQVRSLAQLVAAGDNYAPKVLVTLLDQLVVKNSPEDEIILVLQLMISIVYINPAASDQLCMHDIGTAIRDGNYTVLLHFIFTILSLAQPKAIPDDAAWLGVTLKLLTSLSSTVTVPAKEWSNGELLVISILSLILNHSTHEAMTETSKSILLNPSIVSMFQNSINAAARASPSRYAEEQSKLPSYGTLQSPGLSVLCQDYCRLMHRGSPLIKLIASYCLVELFRQPMDLECNMGSLRSMVAVFEGLIFNSDIRVATNSAQCLSKLICWKIPGLCQTGNNNWCRLIVEELAMLLAAPLSVSKVFPPHHKSAVHVATALLKGNDPPDWMRSVFDESCISAIIQNLSYANITVELVRLFQELLHLGFLKSDHIMRLNAVFQACSKRAEMGDIPDGYTRNFKKMAAASIGSLEENPLEENYILELRLIISTTATFKRDIQINVAATFSDIKTDPFQMQPELRDQYSSPQIYPNNHEISKIPTPDPNQIRFALHHIECQVLQHQEPHIYQGAVSV